MRKYILAAAIAAGLAGPAVAQSTGQSNSAPNNGANELNSRGTLGDAPGIGTRGGPNDCVAGDSRAACQQANSPNDLGPSPDPRAPNAGPEGYNRRPGDNDNSGAVRSEPKSKALGG